MSRFSVFSSTIIAILLIVSLSSSAQSRFETAISEPAVEDGVHALYSPVRFEENRGQAPSEYRYLMRGRGYTAGFATGGLTVAVAEDETAPPLRFRWEGAKRDVSVEAEERDQFYANYLNFGEGGQTKITNVSTFARVRYRGIFDGTDVVYYWNGRHLEFDIEIGANASGVSPVLQIEGSDSLSIDADGDLVIRYDGREIVQRAPRTFSGTRGSERATPSRYRILDQQRVVVEFDQVVDGAPVRIDPVLDFSTFFGGQNNDLYLDVKPDAAGNIYALGQIRSPRLPADSVAPTGIANSGKAYFISKISRDLKSVLFTTYFGAPGMSSSSRPQFSVAPDGNLYVMYGTRSAAANLNLTTGPFVYPANSYSSYDRMVILAFNAAGDTLRYRTLFGCNDAMNPQFVAGNDGLLLAGATSCATFPMSDGAYRSGAEPLWNRTQVLVARLSADGASMPYSTLIGGSGSQTLSSLRRDAQGRIWLSGSTTSADFAVTPGAYGAKTQTGNDAYILRISADGSKLEASTILGGSGGESAGSLVVTDADRVYAVVSGVTSSFPISPNAYQTSFSGSSAAIVRLNAELTTLQWSTFYPDGAGMLTANAAGEVAMLAWSRLTAMPTSQDALLRSPNRWQSMHIGVLSADASQLLFGSYFFLPQDSAFMSLLGFADGELTVASGSFNQAEAPPATSTPLTVDQGDQPYGLYLARINLNNHTSCSIRLSPNVLNVDENATEASLDVQAPPGCPWVVNLPYNTNSRVTLSGSSGVGNGRVKLQFPRSENSSVEQRTVLTADTVTATLVQAAAPCTRRSISPGQIDFSSDGGIRSIFFDIPSNCVWDHTPPAPWVTVEDSRGVLLSSWNTHGASIRAKVSANAFEARETSFTIGGITVPVRQQGGGCTATVSPSVVELPEGGGTASFTLTTSRQDCTWLATTSERLRVQGSRGGTGNARITVSVDANPTNVTQVETLYVGGKTVQVRQAGGHCRATVSPLYMELGQKESRFDLSIKATGSSCSWMPVYGENWLSSAYFSGQQMGDGWINVLARENTSGSTRRSTIQILGHTVEVVQHAQPTQEVKVFSSSVTSYGSFTLNGRTLIGNVTLAMPVGTTFTLKAPSEERPEDGMIIQNKGWDDSGELTRTYTVGNEILGIWLRNDTFYRVRTEVNNNSPGDGSSVKIQPEQATAGNSITLPEGVYYKHGVNYLVTAVDGSRSTFDRWQGEFSNYSTIRSFQTSFWKPLTATAKFNVTGGTPVLQFQPSRLLLRFGTEQDISNAIGVISAPTSTEVVIGSFGCPAFAAPFTVSLMAPKTPMVAELQLQLVGAAALPAGQYECFVKFSRKDDTSAVITIPVDLVIGAPPIYETEVSIGAVVEGAAFRRIPVPSGGIASIFGQNLANATKSAESLPLPTRLADVQVQLTHLETGKISEAPLFFASSQQINFLVPADHPVGATALRVMRDGFAQPSSIIGVNSIQPSFFTANSDGVGAPAGQFLRVNRNTGIQTPEPLAECLSAPGSCTPRRLAFNPEVEDAYLVLYGTGLPAGSGTAVARIGDLVLPVVYMGPQGDFAGLGQVNIRVPQSLMGRGVVTLEFSVDGFISNPVQVRF